MTDQINLFQIMEAPDINDVSEEDAVKFVGNRLGVLFAYNEFLGRWEAKRGKMTMALAYDHYFPDVFDGQLYLGADYRIEDSGGGCPCSGIDEATAYFERKLKEWNQ